MDEEAVGIGIVLIIFALLGACIYSVYGVQVTSYAPFRHVGSGPFGRVVVWRGRWQSAPSNWITNAITLSHYTDTAQVVFDVLGQEPH